MCVSAMYYLKETTIVYNHFPRSAQTYMVQVVNPQEQTPQGQSVLKPVTPLHNAIFENINLTWRSLIVACPIQYSEIRSRVTTIQKVSFFKTKVA